jgi:hypothetical protein
VCYRGLVRAFALAAFSLLVLTACQRGFPQSGASNADQSFAVEIIRALQAGDYAKILKHMNRGDAAEHAPRLENMRLLLPTGLGASPRLVDAKIVPLTATHRSELVYALDGARRHAEIRLTFIPYDADVFLKRLDVFPHPAPIGFVAEPFQLSGKSAEMYMFLTMSMISLGTVFIALYVLYRATNVAQKPYWAVAIVVALGQLTMNWTDGTVTGSVFGFRIFGAWIEQVGPYSPWEVSVSMPLAAYVFLLRQAHAYAAKREIPLQKG